jgi:hypothetical protein
MGTKGNCKGREDILLKGWEQRGTTVLFFPSGSSSLKGKKRRRRRKTRGEQITYFL